MIDDIRVWVDAPDAEPAGELRGYLADWGLTGRHLGVEWDGYGLTARNGAGHPPGRLSQPRDAT